MVRTPCCDKMGLKKGPWTPEEDRVLINHIKLHGHGNWRQLPRLAGLLRCGKSCRLRWTNYLRPDIKRGNFTKQEEDTIIDLHQKLGNRWSAIAAKLPGRTDNEIKNVWHTHLKKRLLKQNKQAITDDDNDQTKNESSNPNQSLEPADQEDSSISTSTEICPQDSKTRPRPESPPRPSSPPQSMAEVNASSMTEESSNSNNDVDNNNKNNLYEDDENNIVVDNFLMSVESESLVSFVDMDEDFWLSEVLSADNSDLMVDEFAGIAEETKLQLPSSPAVAATVEPPQENNSSVMSDNMEFWFQIFTKAEELSQLPDFE